MENVAAEGFGRTEGDLTATNPTFPSPKLLSIMAHDIVTLGDDDSPLAIYFNLWRLCKQSPLVS